MQPLPPTGKGRARRLTSVPTDIVRRVAGTHQATGGGAVPWGPPSGAPGGQTVGGAPRTLNVPVPWSVRPPLARELNIDAAGAGFNNVTTPAVIPGAVFAVPANNVGVIRSVVLNLNAMLATTLIQWTFRANGVAIDGWNGLTIFPRAAGSISVAYGPDETYIPLEEGVTVDVIVTVLPADGGTYQAGVTFHGWTYPKRLADQFASLYNF